MIYRGGNQRVPEFNSWACIVDGLDARSYVELGCGSANWIAKLPRMQRVVTVDILPNGVGGIPHVNASSHDPGTRDRVVEMLGGLPDIVFIDADHEADAVRKDFDLWYPVTRLAVGFHDVKMASVLPFWNWVKRAYPSVEIIARDAKSANDWQVGSGSDGDLDCGGIGVIFKF